MTLSRRHLVSILATSPLLAACGSLVDLPGKGPGATLYNLRGAIPPMPDPRVADPKAKILGVHVTIMEPVADRDLDNDRIALAPSERHIDYYAGAKWSDRAPSLVQSLLLGSLHNSGRLPAVARPGGLMADVAVMGELEQFEARGPTRPTVEISLNLRLVTQPAGRLIKAQRFSKSVPASSADVDSVVVAFETAMNGILVDATAFILSALESR